MSRLVRALARACARHPWAVVAVWLVLVVGVLAADRTLGASQPEELTVPGSDSAAAADVAAHVGGPADDERASTVLVQAAGGGVPPAAPVAAFAAALADVEGVLEVSEPAPAGVDAVQLRVTSERHAATPALQDAVAQARHDGLDVGVGQPLVQDLEPARSHVSEVVGLVAALVVLLLALGAVAAMLVPMLTAVVAVAGALGLIGVLGTAVALPSLVPTLAVMLGLGVGIDYALFQVARQRDVLARGPVGRAEAADRTAATAGEAVAFAGVTVAVAISSLVLTGVDFMAWLGLGTAIAVLVVLAAALTLTPALVALAGRRVLRRRDRGAVAEAPAAVGGGWVRLAAGVARRPWTAVAASAAVLAVLAAPAVGLTLGQSSDADWPTGTERRTAYDVTARVLGEGANGPLALAVALDPAVTGPSDTRVEEVREAVSGVDGVASVGQPQVAPDGTAMTLRVVPETGPADPGTAALVEELRGLAPAGADVHVGGGTAVRLDLADRIAQRLPWLVLATVVVAGVLLGFAYRSFVVPVKAAAMDLVSVAAAYGVVTAVFEWGWGARLVGLDGPVAVDAYVPMMLFAVLFGLSMDYEVFLLSSVREHWLRTRDATAAVSRGLADTGRVITAAAAIMFAVFASFVLVDNPAVKVFGVGLAVAVAVDATVVRCVLGPAVMVLAGRLMWETPRSQRAEPDRDESHITDTQVSLDRVK